MKTLSQLPRLLSLLLSLEQILLSDCCYITRCNTSFLGKKSHPPTNVKSSLGLLTQTSSSTTACSKCGRLNYGVCYGPKLCCGKYGCLSNELVSAECGAQFAHWNMCDVKAPSCKAVVNGRCTPSGLCCDTARCTVDDQCRAEEDRIGMKAQLGSLLSTLLQQQT